MGVVVVQKGHQFLRVGIQKVFHQHFIDLADAVLPALALLHGFLHGKVPREVHRAIKARGGSPTESISLDKGRLFR